MHLVCTSENGSPLRYNYFDTIYFTVANGVKQGGIISPILFNVYMNDLRIALNNSCIEGNLGDAFLNHLCYADDTYLISLSCSRM